MQMDLSKRYQQWDAGRSFFASCLQPLLDVLAMYFLIEVFRAGETEKTVLAVVVRSGMLLGIPLSALLARLKMPINRGLWLIYGLAAVCVFLLPFVQAAFVYISLFCLVSLARDGTNSLLSDVYAGYPKEVRTGRYSTSVVALIAGGLCFSGLVNLLLSREPGQHRLLFPVLALPLLLAALCSVKLPRRIFSEHQGLGLKELAGILKKDKLFMYILISWFLMGSANLWLITYRTNMLVEPQFGFTYGPERVVLLLVIVPEAVRLLCIPVYVRLVDRVNFIVLRIILNIFFCLYIGCFFIGGQLIFHLLGVVFFGLAYGGGAIIWRLWINKYAPPGQSAAYMALHAGFTGIRSILTPIFGLFALNRIGPVVCALISLGLLTASILMLLFIIPTGRSRFNH